MISPNIEPDCINARLYYHDYLDRVKRDNMPKNAYQHIKECRYCQDEISLLENMLSQVKGDAEQSWRSSAIITILRLHFSYIGKSIKCKTVKPFLPSLAIPGLEINIPTPITTHIDSCQACANDFSIIKDLVLNRRQLFRLGRFLLEKPDDDRIDCPQARFAIPSVVSMNLKGTNTDILRHLCICPDCRRLLYQHQGLVCDELACRRPSGEDFPCESVSTADIFSYCLPYDIDPAHDEYAEFRESLTSHLRKCPKCITKVQHLHTIICDIAERPDSGVVTSFALDEPIEEIITGYPDEVSINWPVEEKIRDEQPVYSGSGIIPVASLSKLKRKASNLHLKRYIKPAVGLAAVFLVALTLFFSTSPAKAVSLGDIYQAIGNVTNVCISRFRMGSEEPYEECWISQSLNIRLIVNSEQVDLENLENWTRKQLDIRSNSVIETVIQVDSRKDIVNLLNNAFGLVPFTQMSEAPKGAQWEKVNNITTIPGTEVYDLTWTDTPDIGSIVHRMWRVYVDTATDLPIKIEWYRKTTLDEEYKLEIFSVVTYPTDIKIRSLIQDKFINVSTLN